MKRVLFVDDEPNILSGLRRMLRGMRHEWEMDFQPSGQAALDAIAKEPFDIVVSDMKMPGMDGAELLSEVKRRHPESIRLILSGHSERAAVMKSVGPTHQYLSKPCEPEILKATIQRAYSLRAMLESDSLKKLAADLESIPSMPALYQEIVAKLQDPLASLDSVGKIIERDVGMSAKILKLVNSCYFGLLRPVNSVERAVVFLGLETVNSLVFGAQIFSEYEEIKIPGFSIDALWTHSMDTAAGTRAIAKAEGVDKCVADDAFMAGMLHDVGRLVLFANVPEQYGEVHRLAAEKQVRIEDAESEVLQATHGEVGAYIMGIWGLPNTIVEAIAYHSNPTATSVHELDAVTIVHVADVLMSEAKASGASTDSLDMECLETLGLKERLPAWREACAELLQQETEA